MSDIGTCETLQELRFPERRGIGSPIEKLELLYGLVRSLKPRTVVETGTYRGSGAVAMGHALRQNAVGALMTADIFELGAQELIEENGLEEWVEFHHHSGVELVRKLDQIDFAFIDCGWLSRRPTFDLVLERLSPGGMIVVDDVFHPHWDRDAGVEDRAHILELCQFKLSAFHGLAFYDGGAG